MDAHPLLDEIAVIDSGSTDNTCKVARDFGADVYIAENYLKRYGKKKGKGENLWKSIYLLKGDILVFIDSDITNIHPRFVYGLLGPLLTSDKILFTKGFYDRPLTVFDSTVNLGGGGRVSEILVRPLFCQFFPDLSAVIQPLSGEYAGYRKVFEKLAFPAGYGVETAMLIDIFIKYGLKSIAQTDLDCRIHRNQLTKSLGKMAFSILQSFWRRLAEYKNILKLEPESYFINQFDPGHKIEIHRTYLQESERPPMIQIPEYKKKMGYSI